MMISFKNFRNLTSCIKTLRQILNFSGESVAGTFHAVEHVNLTQSPQIHMHAL